MAVVKRISVMAALLVVPAGLAWGSQVLTSPVGSPDVGNATITLAVVPGADPADPSAASPDPAATGAPASAVSGSDVPAPAVTAPSIVPAPIPDPLSEVQRQPIPVPQTWDDDWDDDDWDDGGDDDGGDDDGGDWDDNDE